MEARDYSKTEEHRVVDRHSDSDDLYLSVPQLRPRIDAIYKRVSNRRYPDYYRWCLPDVRIIGPIFYFFFFFFGIIFRFVRFLCSIQENCSSSSVRNDNEQIEH